MSPDPRHTEISGRRTGPMSSPARTPCEWTSASSGRASGSKPTMRRTTPTSRGPLFDFLPFYHNGLRLQIPVTDKVSLSYMLTNGIQQTEDFNNFKSNQFMAVITPVKSVSWTVNYYTEIGRASCRERVRHWVERGA